MVDGAAIEVALMPVNGRWWSVDLSLGGITRTEIASLDPTRRLARVEFDGARAEAVSDFPIRRLTAIVQTLIAAEALGVAQAALDMTRRSEEHTSELQSLMRISYAVFCLKKKKYT